MSEFWFLTICFIFLLYDWWSLIQSDVKLEDPATTGQSLVTLDWDDLAELGPAGPHVVPEAARDLALEVELSDEGLATVSRSDDLDMEYITEMILRGFTL